ncbi:ATP-binding cassette domain-containing protein [Sedimentibacter sp. zth1]|uniref:ATP-binding cassette domain-containing protein n=1 Tax=Sedimentibacter sp. zth1 TaxID=2816908 RepID=UPI001A928C68|nr:ATP-binding cassette domain-containing protein [Sedimentibacter sp. zth1]QSX05003.1 ATP-binding cassette domain-containing protein [Sedimentibacter sp. zth1]
MIKIEGVSKSYGKKEKKYVLNNINLSIPDNEVVALLGHNGSGKSTLIKCLTGILKPTNGKISIDNFDTFKYRKKLIRNMGIIFNQKSSFITDLSVYDNLLFFKAIYEISDEKFKKMINLIDKYIEIKKLFENPYRKLSFGERVKCEITSILLHTPKYIILDEPTIGLDYNAKKGLYQLLAYFKNNLKSTIIIITHEIDYIENICDRAIILNKGQVKYDGKSNVICSSATEKIKVIVKYKYIIDEIKAKHLLDNATEVNEVKHLIVFDLKDNTQKDKYVKNITNAFSIEGISTEKVSLREVFEDVLSETKKC